MPLSSLAPSDSVDRAASDRVRRPALLAVEAILADLQARRTRLGRVAGGGDDGILAALADVDALIDWAVALRAGLGATAPGCGALPAGARQEAWQEARDDARSAEAAAAMA